MISERVREALMRLTMCAREECGMCKYKERCDFDFQCKLATESMNILVEALRKTEPQTCDTCKFADKEWYEEPCDRCDYMGNYSPKTEPQTEVKVEPEVDCSWK